MKTKRLIYQVCSVTFLSTLVLPQISAEEINPEYTLSFTVDSESYPGCKEIKKAELIGRADRRYGNFVDRKILVSSGCKDIDDALLKEELPLQEPMRFSGKIIKVTLEESDSSIAKKKFSKLSTCDKFKIINRAFFEGDGAEIEYLDGKKISSNNLGKIAFEWIRNNPQNIAESHLLEKWTKDREFRRREAMSQLDNNQTTEVAWAGLPDVYKWYLKTKKMESCPWGLTENDLQIVLRWMNSSVVSWSENYKAPEYVFKIITNRREVRESLMSKQEKYARQNPEYESDRKIREDLNRKATEFAASPAGIEFILRRNYTQFMAVQDCHEIRSRYTIKYIDPETYKSVKSAMRSIENTIKGKLPKLNTSKVWDDAKAIYFGKFEEANPIDLENAATIASIGTEPGVSDMENLQKRMDNFFGALQNFTPAIATPSNVRKMVEAQKSTPEKYNKDLKTVCTIMASNIMKSISASDPKKDF